MGTPGNEAVVRDHANSSNRPQEMQRNARTGLRLSFGAFTPVQNDISGFPDAQLDTLVMS